MTGFDDLPPGLLPPGLLPPGLLSRPARPAAAPAAGGFAVEVHGPGLARPLMVTGEIRQIPAPDRSKLLWDRWEGEFRALLAADPGRWPEQAVTRVRKYLLRMGRNADMPDQRAEVIRARLEALLRNISAELAAPPAAGDQPVP